MKGRWRAVERSHTAMRRKNSRLAVSGPPDLSPSIQLRRSRCGPQAASTWISTVRRLTSAVSAAPLAVPLKPSLVITGARPSRAVRPWLDAR